MIDRNQRLSRMLTLSVLSLLVLSSLGSSFAQSPADRIGSVSWRDEGPPNLPRGPQMLVWGPLLNGTTENGVAAQSVLWSLPLQIGASMNWSTLVNIMPSASPQAAYFAAAAYDDESRRPLLYGGQTSPQITTESVAVDQFLGMKFIYGSNPLQYYWERIITSGPAPPLVKNTTIVYVPTLDNPAGGLINHRIIRFGGTKRVPLQYGYIDDPINETWQCTFPNNGLLNSCTWSQITTPSFVPKLYGHISVYVPSYGALFGPRMVVIGRLSKYSGDLGVWTLDLINNTWSTPYVGGTTAAPQAREFLTGVYNPNTNQSNYRGEIVVYANLGNGYAGYQRVYNLGVGTDGGFAWSYGIPTGDATVNIPTVSPVDRWKHTAIYDPPCDRMIVFGDDQPGATTREARRCPVAGATWNFGFWSPPTSCTNDARTHNCTF